MAVDNTVQLEGPAVEGPADSAAYAIGELSLEAMAERCGADVVRLRAEAPELLAAVAGAGYRTVRTRNAASVLALDGEKSAFEVTGDRLEWVGQGDRLESETGAWACAYLGLGLEGDRSPLVIYDDRGEPVLEFVLAEADVERLAAHLPGLEHPCQVAHEPPVSREPTPTIHRSTVDEERLEACWRRGGDFETIRRLAEEFRLERVALLERLAARWATRLQAEAICSLTNTAADLELPCAFETRSAATRARMVSEFTVHPRNGPAMLVASDDQEMAFGPGRIDRVYSLRKPTDEGLAAAVEAYDGTGELQLRMRLSPEATSEDRMMWRSCLPFGRMCAG